MKTKGLTGIVALVGILFIFIAAGTVHAVLGVADDVPGQDIVFPIICEGYHSPSGGKPVFGSLNTLWAIGDHAAAGDEICPYGVCSPHDGGLGVVRAIVTVFDKASVHRFDTAECWSMNDIISNDCQGLISSMSTKNQKTMEVTIGGITYFAGYVLYHQDAACSGGLQNRFSAWVYLNDIVSGFATGYNGISLENGASPHLQETCNGTSCKGGVPVTAESLYPRYFLLNGDPDSFNWWIFLVGSNQSGRGLSCLFCDEHENCFSGGLEMPFELDIVDVAGIVPGALFPADSFPKAGFALCDFGESVSIFGWSYQRAAPVSSPVKISVIHQIHRE